MGTNQLCQVSQVASCSFHQSCMARPLFFFCVWVRVARPLFFSFVFGYPNTKEKKRSVPKHKRKKAVWPRGTKFSLPFILGIHPIIIQLYYCQQSWFTQHTIIKSTSKIRMKQAAQTFLHHFWLNGDIQKYNFIELQSSQRKLECESIQLENIASFPVNTKIIPST